MAIYDNYRIRFNTALNALEMNVGGEDWELIPGIGTTVTANEIDSEAATDGQVLTADGAGGASWEDAAIPTTFVDGEVPSGAINGSNATFTLAVAPNPSTSLQLYKNGVRLKLTDDYSLSTLTITMVSAPASLSTLLADYRH